MGDSTSLTVSLCWAQLFCLFDNKIPFSCYMQIFANGVCIQCHNVQLIEEYSNWPSSGCCPSRACVEHFISCIHTTLSSAAFQSCLKRQVVLFMSLTNLLEVHPLLLKNSTKKIQAKERFEHFFSESEFAISMSTSFSYCKLQHMVTALWSHNSWNTSLALSASAGMNCFAPSLALTILLLHVHSVAKNNVTKWHHFYWLVDLCLPMSISREGGVQSTLFCNFNHCYFISCPNKLKICHTVKQL